MKPKCGFIFLKSNVSHIQEKLLEKFIWLYIIIACIAFIIYVTTEFVLANMFQYIVISIEVLLLLIFSFYVVKNIRAKKIDYSLNSFTSYIGLIGINLIIFALFHFGFLYPLSYLLHEGTKNIKKEKMRIVSKLDVISSTQYMKKYRYKIWLKNENFSKVVYLNDNQISKKDYDKISINDTMKLNVEKSFFGYIINKLEYEETNKTL